MRKFIRTSALGAIVLAFALVAAACSSGGGTIEIGSFGFAESQILGEIYAQALEAEGYDVNHQSGLGSRESVVQPAMESGELNFVPEYLGSSLEVGFGGTPTSDPDATRTALLAAAAGKDLTVLDYAPAEDKNGYVVTSETASTFGLANVSDLAAVSADLIFGGPSECDIRPRCLEGLYSVYGIPEFADVKELDTGGPLTKTALGGGEIDVAMLFTSDGSIFANGWVLLNDDQGLQPAENIIPLVSQELIDDQGDEFVNLVNSITARISQAELTEMNRQVGFDGESVEDVAAAFLQRNGFIGG
jgi:osmoprotectant transport system substrate-binding protein